MQGRLCASTDSRFALPHLKRGASIINTSSVTAFKGSQAMVDYSSTKGAIITFTRSMAMQLAPKGIRINVVCPGEHETSTVCRCGLSPLVRAPPIHRLGVLRNVTRADITLGPVHTPLQPASRPGEQMEDFQIGKLPLWGRANMPAEMGPAYGTWRWTTGALLWAPHLLRRALDLRDTVLDQHRHPKAAKQLWPQGFLHCRRTVV